MGGKVEGLTVVNDAKNSFFPTRVGTKDDELVGFQAPHVLGLVQKYQSERACVVVSQPRCGRSCSDPLVTRPFPGLAWSSGNRLGYDPKAEGSSLRRGSSSLS